MSMIDVGAKPLSRREAKACATVKMLPSTINLIKEGKIPKGNVLEVARTAGILAAKNVPHLIPLCHPVNINWVEINFNLQDYHIEIEANVKGIDKTGVEMEALTAVAVAALSVYDMCKGVDKNIVIKDIRLVEKKKEEVG